MNFVQIYTFSALQASSLIKMYRGLAARRALPAMTPEGWCKLMVEQYQLLFRKGAVKSSIVILSIAPTMLLFRKSAVKRAKFEGLTRNIRAVDAHSS